jgi:RimJ/RimL family protein N-acetyltransferase
MTARSAPPASSARRIDLGGRIFLAVTIAITLAIVAGRIAVVRSAEGDTAFLSANDRSRWCTIRALVDDGTYEIDSIIREEDPETGRRYLASSPARLYELIWTRTVATQMAPAVFDRVAADVVGGDDDALTFRVTGQVEKFDGFLRAYRAEPSADIDAVALALVKLSQLSADIPEIRELDINPLLASPERLISLDARVVLHDPETEDLPRTAIRPYPTQYIWAEETRDGEPVTIRPIRPEDEPLMVKFHESLSEQSVYMRYFHMLNLSQRTAHERLTRICFIDYDREMALVAERTNPDTGEREIMGVARLSRPGGIPDEAEFSVLISDRFQRRGLGTLLVSKLLEVGRAEGLRRITADILFENYPMQRISRNLGFHLHRDTEEMVMKADHDLYQPA